MLGVNEMKGMVVVSVHKNGKVVWNNSGIPNLVERERETKDSKCRTGM